MIIAIDGPAGTGKSTVAKGVARRLGFFCFDTGAMYRAIAWKARENKISFDDEAALHHLAEHFHCDIRTDERGRPHYFVDEKDISEAIRTPEISRLASQIAVFPFVRQALVRIQRRFGHHGNVVFEGRDMGTVVFPDAELKIFLTARLEVRVQRRYQELQAKFPDLTSHPEQILEEMKERDTIDANRKISPLKQAEDAILIDTSDRSAEEIIDQIVALQKKVRPKKKKSNWSYKVGIFFTRLLLKWFYRLKLKGVSSLPQGPSIIAANHASYLDPMIVAASCPEEIYFVAKDSLFHVPLLGCLIRRLNSLPVARNASDAHMFRDLLKILEEDKKVLLFPEGARSSTGKLQLLERGVAFLASKAQCNIIPCYIHGAWEVWPIEKKFPKLWGKVRCTFGPPIERSRFAHLEKKEELEQVTRELEKALKLLSQRT